MAKTFRNHLISRLPNTAAMRALVKTVNRMARKSDSRWHLRIRGRIADKAKMIADGAPEWRVRGCGNWDGCVPLRYAKFIALYVEERDCKAIKEWRQQRWEESRKWERKQEEREYQRGYTAGFYAGYQKAKEEATNNLFRGHLQDEQVISNDN